MALDSHLSSLKLSAFRNYASLSVAFAAKHVVLTGPNGAGKTNLLEAVSFLSPGRGLRRAQLADVAMAGSNAGFAVNVTLERDGDATIIGTGTAPGDALQRKVRINSTTAKSADELLELCRVIWLTPSMDGLFTGPAADRRRFLDRMVLAIDPAHGRRAADYEKAMRQRNRLLEDFRDSQSDGWIDAAEAQLAALGSAMIAARQELAGLLTGIIAQGNGEDRPFPTASLAIEGALERDAREGMPAGDIEDALLRIFRDQRMRDRTAGRTLAGPHRAEFAIRHRQKDMPAALCSTGEQKALLIGLVLAHARLTRTVSGLAPIMLLDEIAAHLDPLRRAALFEQVDAAGGQAFMTGTDRSLFDALEDRAQRFRVETGGLRDDSEISDA
ncbi:DNA replication/repair protein RecF [Oricola cellulosilytica]|uniref:DNA replication and repair protein RecF n=1 Tax=Oricola cellulosilytica TaxID=1429082 RepID=A0A4V2MP53_9HYPH|nr:DNA replication/repair protein RecF [Oricola cellulosilytica]TCD16362.1 DNA replication/repair protein RecF [Oricola cellulosilytica]